MKDTKRLYSLLVHLNNLHAPLLLLLVVQLLFQNLDCSQNLDGLENFAGVAVLKRVLQTRGLRATALDIIRDPIMHNINEEAGFLHALHMLLCLKDAAVHLTAPVCTSWVFLNCATSGRRLLRPLGVPTGYVVYANRI